MGQIMTQSFQHKELAAGRWFTLSLAEQMANIGSEVNRAIKARDDLQRYENAINRAFELIYLTISDVRWRKRLRELTRFKEVFCDAVLGGKEYGSTLEDLNKYLFQFAMAARLHR